MELLFKNSFFSMDSPYLKGSEQKISNQDFSQQQKNVKIAQQSSNPVFFFHGQSTINYQTKESIPDSSQNINGNTSKQSSNPILFHQQNVNVHQQSSSPIFSQQNQKNYNICQNS